MLCIIHRYIKQSGGCHITIIWTWFSDFDHIIISLIYPDVLIFYYYLKNMIMFLWSWFFAHVVSHLTFFFFSCKFYFSSTFTFLCSSNIKSYGLRKVGKLKIQIRISKETIQTNFQVLVSIIMLWRISQTHHFHYSHGWGDAIAFFSAQSQYLWT